MSAISTAPALKSLWRVRQKVFVEIVEALSYLATSLPLLWQNPEQHAAEHKQAQNITRHPMKSIHPHPPRPRTGGQTSTQPSPTHRPSGHVIKSTPVWRTGDRSPPKRSVVGAIPSPARSRGDVGRWQSPRWSVSGGARRDRRAVAGMR